MHVALTLTRAEEAEAAAVLERYRGFITAQAFRYSGEMAEFDDLAQVGRLAAIKAVRDHDPARPGACSQDAFVWRYIRTAIWQQLRAHNGLVRVPANKARTGRTFTRSLDVPLSDDSDGTAKEMLMQPDADPVLGEDGMAVIRQALARLPAREKDVLMQIYFEGKSASELARERGFTHQYMNQIRVKGLKRLRGFAAVQDLLVEGRAG